MKEIIKELKKVNQFKGRNSKKGAYTGSLCSFFHSTITSCLLCFFFVIVSSKQHFGDPIKCFTEKKPDQDQPLIPEAVINSFCFMSNTYSVNFNKHLISSELYDKEYPGLGQHSKPEQIHRHTYYQWVPLVLLLQAILFKMPHWLWTHCEGGLVTNIIAELNEDLEIRLPHLKRSPKIEKVADYFYKRCGDNGFLGVMWILGDIMALAVIFVNFFITDALLGGSFKRGIPILDWKGFDGNATDSAAFFPILTKCNIATYGSGGGIQNIDSICVMTLNIVYEKIFFFIWIWFCILAPLTCITILIKFVRIVLLKYRSRFYWQNTISVPTRISGYELTHCVATMGFGDCVLFNLITQNMRPVTYKVFVRELSNRKVIGK